MNRLESASKARIIITQQLAAQVECLHNQCPTGKEWSGLLVFQITKGSIEDLENLEIKAESVFLMDFGDATFTSFEGNEDWLKFFAQFPEIDPLKRKPDSKWFIGKIHSHHNMRAFHSGVDTTDLYENAPKLPFFLSLVVNYSCEPFAEIAIQAEVEEREIKRTKWKLLKGWNLQDNVITKKKENKPSIFIVPCVVVYSQLSWFLDQLKAVRDRNTKPVYEYTAPVKPAWKPIEQPSTNSSIKHLNTKTYSRLLTCFGDLITLGLAEKGIVAYNAMTTMNDKIPAVAKDDYKKAFKAYFCNHWFDEHFYNIDEATELVVIGYSLEYIDFHKTLWLHPILKEALNELKTEHKHLRSFQNSSVV